MKDFVSTYVIAKITNCAKRPGTTKICDKLYLAGQLTEDELRGFAKTGCRSVLNLRQPDEAGQFGLGMLAKEQDFVESLGLTYVNVPVPREGNYEVELCQKVSFSLARALSLYLSIYLSLVFSFLNSLELCQKVYVAG
jgi:hypothetical protein